MDPPRRQQKTGGHHGPFFGGRKIAKNCVLAVGHLVGQEVIQVILQRILRQVLNRYSRVDVILRISKKQQVYPSWCGRKGAFWSWRVSKKKPFMPGSEERSYDKHQKKPGFHRKAHVSTVDGTEIPNNHLRCINPVNTGINYQPQLVIAGFLNHQQ